MSNSQPKPTKVCLDDIPRQSWGDTSSKCVSVHSSRETFTAQSLPHGRRVAGRLVEVLLRATGMAVLIVDYGLAPEHS